MFDRRLQSTLKYDMPRRELSRPRQVADWLEEWGRALSDSGAMVLIGSGGLLWHAHEQGIGTPFPDRSMDVDPVTQDESVARLGYDAMIGSEFELRHGWHVNLMPMEALDELPAGWEGRAARKSYGRLTVTIPAPEDLVAPKLKRGEPRDLRHAEWARRTGLLREEKR